MVITLTPPPLPLCCAMVRLFLLVPPIPPSFTLSPPPSTFTGRPPLPLNSPLPPAVLDTGVALISPRDLFGPGGLGFWVSASPRPPIRLGTLFAGVQSQVAFPQPMPWGSLKGPWNKSFHLNMK